MDLFDLVAKITLDSSEYEKGIQGAGEGASALSSKWAGFGKVAAGVGAATVAAVGAAAVGVGKLTKASVEAYANYEQLAGGVKKLFGKEASAEVMRYASEAYKTSGMSANQYMEQATQFSAALINSLGDQSAAAKQTDVAMRAISDNYNTFGGDIQNVQNAFQGFAKGQFNMLDNLRLGYGGTRGEMERLIADANEYAEANGMAADLSIDSFSDIVTAIDLIQQKQGIAGTTAAEAAKTIEGSLNMTKAAWENLVAGFADPDADLGQLMDNLVVAIVGEGEGEGLLNQILPAIQRAMEGIGQLLEQAAPILAEQLPPIIETMLPSLISAAMSLVTGLVNALPSLIQVFVAQMPTIITTIITALTEALPMLAEVIPELILTLAEGIGESLPTLIPAIVQMVVEIVNTLLSNVDMLVNAAIQLMQGLLMGLIQAIPLLIAAVPRIIQAIIGALISAGGMLISTGAELIGKLGSGIASAFSTLWSNVVNFARKIPTSIKNGVGNLKSIGLNLIEGLWKGIKEKFDSVIQRVKDLAAKLPTAVKKVLGIASPSKVFAEVGKWIPEGLALGIESNLGSVENAADAMIGATAITPTFGNTGLLGTTEGEFGRLSAILQEWLPQLSNMDIVLDSGELVGSLSRTIDSSLGSRQKNRERGNA